MDTYRRASRTPAGPLNTRPPTAPTSEIHMNYESPIGRAIALLRAGKRLPISLTAELREQGYDIPSLHTAHLNQKV